jgi:hypothetical protein
MELLHDAFALVGPFTVDAKRPGRTATAGRRSRDRWSGAFVNADFLTLGLDRSCATILRLHADGPSALTRVGANAEPFPPDVVAADRAAADAAGLTAEGERALLGSFPALEQFLWIAMRTPELRQIIMSVMDVPLVWFIANGGKAPDLSINFTGTEGRLDAAPWQLPEDKQPYGLSFVLNMNAAPALKARLAVVAPRPPLVASAGIVGIVVQRPDGRGPVLSIRLIASRRAPEARPPAADGGS